MSMKSIFAPMVDGRRVLMRGAEATAQSPDERCPSDELEAVPSWLKLYRDGWEDAWASPAGLSQVHSSVIVLNQNGKLYVSS